MSPVRRNAVANYVNFVALAALNLLFSPILATSLGAVNFGLWKTCLRVLDFAAVADGRTTQALKWLVAFGSEEVDPDGNQRQLGASLLVWLFWLPALTGVLALTIFLLPAMAKGLDPEQTRYVRVVSLILALNVILGGLLGIPDAVLSGINQGYKSTDIKTLLIIISNIAMAIFAVSGGGLFALAGITLVASVLNGALTFMVARRRVPWWGIRRPYRSELRRVSGFSGWTLGWTFVQMLLLSTELLLLGNLLGPATVTRYSFTSYGAQFALSACLLTASAIMPRMGAALGAGRAHEASELASQTREIVLALAAVSGSGLLIMNRDFVVLWSGANNYLGDTVNGLMVLAFFQLAFIRCDAQIQDVGLNIRARVLIGLASSAASALFAWLAFLAIPKIASVYLGLLVGRMLMSLAFPRLVASTVIGTVFPSRAMVVALTMLAASYVAGLHLHLQDWPSLFLCAAIAGALLLISAYALILSPRTRARLRGVRYEESCL